MHSGLLEEAETLLETTLNAFYSKMETEGKLYVSVANKEELAAFHKEHPGAQVVWLDYAFGEALHLHTYIAVERRNFEEALQRSEREMEFRPYAADTWTERGIILNHQHRPKEALKAYRRARQVAERFASNSDHRPAVLRGIGFTQVELGNLEAARKAIEASLDLAPENKLGLNELEYIKRLQKRQRRRERNGDETE
jgi:tetratricopeptide (TPR) repeat protein